MPNDLYSNRRIDVPTKKKSKLSTVPPAPKGEERGATSTMPTKRIPAISKAVSEKSRGPTRTFSRRG